MTIFFFFPGWGMTNYFCYLGWCNKKCSSSKKLPSLRCLPPDIKWCVPYRCVGILYENGIITTLCYSLSKLFHLWMGRRPKSKLAFTCDHLHLPLLGLTCLWSKRLFYLYHGLILKFKLVYKSMFIRTIVIWSRSSHLTHVLLPIILTQASCHVTKWPELPGHVAKNNLSFRSRDDIIVTFYYIV